MKVLQAKFELVVLKGIADGLKSHFAIFIYLALDLHIAYEPLNVIRTPKTLYAC